MDAWIKSGLSWIPGVEPEMKAVFQNGNFVDGGIYALATLPGGFGKAGGKGLGITAKRGIESLGAGRTTVKQWLQGGGNLERGTLIQYIESAGSKE